MSKTVLVVDDSVSMRQMVTFTLKGAGFEVVEAGDGKEAVAKLNGGAKPNLVITDLNMPNMDGISLIKEIRGMAAHKFTPVLMLTTESADDSSGRLSVRPQRCQGTARKRPGMAHGDGLDDGQTVGGTDRIGGLENSNGRRSGAGSALAGGEG